MNTDSIEVVRNLVFDATPLVIAELDRQGLKLSNHFDEMGAGGPPYSDMQLATVIYCLVHFSTPQDCPDWIREWHRLSEILTSHESWGR